MNKKTSHPTPTDLVLSKATKKGWRRLFKAKTVLYLRFTPTPQTEAVEKRLQEYFKGRPHTVSRGLLLYPILLIEDFYIRKEKPSRKSQADENQVEPTRGVEDIRCWNSCPCKCILPIEEEPNKAFSSLNQAVKYAVEKWTGAQSGFSNTFERVLFEYHCGLLKMDYQRRAVLNHETLPHPRLKQPELF